MKEEIFIKVMSSSGEPYNVHFKFSNNMFSIFCSCPAGIHGKLCKHKASLLNGDTSLLFDESDTEIFDQIYEIIKKSKYIEIISSYNLLKNEIDQLQKKEKRIKEQIEYSLKTGIEYSK